MRGSHVAFLSVVVVYGEYPLVAVKGLYKLRPLFSKIQQFFCNSIFVTLILVFYEVIVS